MKTKALKTLLASTFIVMATASTASAVSYQNWTVGEIRSNIASSIHQNISVPICYDSSYPKMTVLSGYEAVKTIANFDKDLKVYANLAKMLLSDENTRAILVEGVQESVNYLYVPYPEGYSSGRGHLIRLNPIVSDDDPIVLECTTCVSSSGWYEEGDPTCQCNDDSYEVCDDEPVCGVLTLCQTCYLVIPGNEEPVAMTPGGYMQNICPTVPEPVWVDPTQFDTIPVGTIISDVSSFL